MANIAVRSVNPFTHRDLCDTLTGEGHTIVYDQITDLKEDPKKVVDGILERSPDAIVIDGALGQRSLLEEYATRTGSPPLVALTRVSNANLKRFAPHLLEGETERGRLGVYLTDLLK
ncbi:MAG TPA: hypothetical protein VJG90_00830 [Candidatus Nanoarchaeia archaeon]|nr:hypothetical protein [Candidatus Nanoarchaeia archaeon]